MFLTSPQLPFAILKKRIIILSELYSEPSAMLFDMEMAAL